LSDPDNRAHLGKARIKARLIADLDPDEWDLPPKPKWMRWHTYNRYAVMDVEDAASAKEGQWSKAPRQRSSGGSAMLMSTEPN
jgi:hypothetical protein